MAPLSIRTRLRRRSAALLAAGILLPLPVLAACGLTEDDGDAGVITPRDVNALPRDKVADKGTLRWAVDALPATLNTFQSDADAATRRVAAATLPALFTLDDHGRPRRDPDYLASAEVVQRAPRQVVVYRLNPRAAWNDGKPLSVADFQAQWQALRGRDSGYWTARNAGYDRIDRVERGADDHEVKVTFARPCADWAALFTPLYPKSVMGDANAFNDSARNELKVSAGPFRVGPRDNGQGTLALLRDPKWWGDRAKLDQLVLRAVPRGERAAALAAGRLDLAEVSAAEAGRITAANTPRGKKGEKRAAPPAGPLRGLAVRRSLEPTYTQLALNGSSGALADERVRHAVARALDRKVIAESVLRPLGLPAVPQGSHLFMAGQQGYEDHSDAIGGTDPKTAGQLLADAGWREHGPARGTDGKRAPVAPPVRMKDGKRLSLRFVLPEGSGAEVLRAVGDRIARQLDAVGIHTEITKVADAGYFKDHVAAGTYDLALYAWPATAYPSTDARPVFAKPQPAADGSLLVEQNYTRVGTDQIDQLFEQASTELDTEVSRDLVGRADARIWAAAGSIPLYQRPELVAARATVVNAGAFGLATPRYQDVGFRY
ncbi:hypothetical protein AF335_25610 [Streptomyces eurocidicus]|uniref:Peptide/nickel transport system substrate-binding protein n=1 Tax=Streptomyces eurocidicus TaxID=66423 RepID=A0A2N8NRJ7_STREU|nr:ABC transporter family substrate-binding protein [Streptomyces eurocidicus]MBB5117218.1 peptide/nickel transport system substrate-binding protein [Streptomyces eurocidicus]MBF6052490.1 ABC transporter family substrate-binding protein [Streptomyces eurocidicus]PNE31397.1 hypothetical protein AF335_25610 [Streptomyces eurocidicus]